MVKLSLQLVKFSCHVMYFKDDRSNQRKVARAVPANERLILDRFNAKWTFHILFKPKPTAARPEFSLRIAEFGPKQVALERKFSKLGPQRCGNNDVAVAGPTNNSLLVICLGTKRTKHRIFLLLRNFQGKDAASGSTFRIRHLDADIVLTNRRFGIGNIDTSSVRKSQDARRDINFRDLEINHPKRSGIDAGSAERLKPDLKAHGRICRFARLHQFYARPARNAARSDKNAFLRQVRFLLSDEHRSGVRIRLTEKPR